MTEKKRFAVVFSLGILLGAGMTLYSSVFAKNDEPAVSALPLEDLRAFSEVFGKVKSDYVETVEDEKLLENAIKGMLSGLDPHSSYLNKEEFKEMRIGTDGKFGGLGIEGLGGLLELAGGRVEPGRIHLGLAGLRQGTARFPQSLRVLGSPGGEHFGIGGLVLQDVLERLLQALELEGTGFASELFVLAQEQQRTRASSDNEHVKNQNTA